jgi:hypothetical protein
LILPLIGEAGSPCGNPATGIFRKIPAELFNLFKVEPL